MSVKRVLEIFHHKSAALFKAKFTQNLLHQAPLGQCALQQVGADKGGEGQPPLADKDGAAGDAQRQGQQNEGAGDDAHDLPGSHVHSP